MKNIIIKGEKFYYECITYNIQYPYNDAEYTYFYRGVNTYKKKKYFYGLLGPMITIEEGTDFAFAVKFIITSPDYTKSWLKEKLEAEYDEYKNLLNRENEIKNEELI